MGFDGSTLIVTKEGQRQISELKGDTPFQAWNGTAWVQAAVVSGGEHQCVQLLLADGSILTCTTDQVMGVTGGAECQGGHSLGRVLDPMPPPGTESLRHTKVVQIQFHRGPTEVFVVTSKKATWISVAGLRVRSAK